MTYKYQALFFTVIDGIPSTRRNHILADVFQRLGYMERKGRGLAKIINAYQNA
jgi:predicted HTH transcriptional regulator